MELKAALSELESLGNPTVFRQNTKRGAGENQFGVKMGDIRKVAAKIKSDHQLALELWKTGNVDARFLAILILKPKELSLDELETMVKYETFVHVADWLYSYVLKNHPEKEEVRLKWLKSDNKMLLRAAWSLMSGKIARDSAELDLKAILDQLEKEMPLERD